MEIRIERDDFVFWALALVGAVGAVIAGAAWTADRAPAPPLPIPTAQVRAAVPPPPPPPPAAPPTAAAAPAAAAPPAGAPIPGTDVAAVENDVELLRQRLMIDPDDLAAWKAMGRNLVTLGRYGDAVGAFSQAARIAPRDPEVAGALSELNRMAEQMRVHDGSEGAAGMPAMPVPPPPREVPSSATPPAAATGAAPPAATPVPAANPDAPAQVPPALPPAAGNPGSTAAPVPQSGTPASP